MQPQYYPSFAHRTEALSSLFESNRRPLKKIFNAHSLSRDNKIPINEFLNFCKNTKIFPDLISMIDLKRVLNKLTHTHFSSKVSMSFQQFEQCLKHLAICIYQPTTALPDKLQLLLTHIRNPCKVFYNAPLNLSKVPTRNPTPNSSIGSDEGMTARKLEEKPQPQKVAQIKQSTFDISAAIEALKNTRKQLKSKHGKLYQKRGSSAVNKQGTGGKCAKILKISPVTAFQSPDSSSYTEKYLKTQQTQKLDLSELNRGVSEAAETERIESWVPKHVRHFSEGMARISPRFGHKQSSDSTLQKIQEAMIKFQTAHEQATQIPIKSSKATLLRKQQGFTNFIRRKYFSSEFIKRMIFGAWKQYFLGEQGRVASKTINNARIQRYISKY